MSYSLHADQINVDSSLCQPGFETVSAVLCEERGSHPDILARLPVSDRQPG